MISPTPRPVEESSSVSGASRGPRTVVELYDRFALRDWAMMLDTTTEKLLEAVDAVGDRVEDVDKYLRSHR